MLELAATGIQKINLESNELTIIVELETNLNVLFFVCFYVYMNVSGDYILQYEREEGEDEVSIIFTDIYFEHRFETFYFMN